jgi:hypothetical protein
LYVEIDEGHGRRRGDRIGGRSMVGATVVETALTSIRSESSPPDDVTVMPAVTITASAAAAAPARCSRFIDRF